MKTKNEAKENNSPLIIVHTKLDLSIAVLPVHTYVFGLFSVGNEKFLKAINLGD